MASPCFRAPTFAQKRRLLEKSEYLTEEMLGPLQKQLLGRSLQVVAEVPFYREKLTSVQKELADPLALLAKLPLVDKSMLRENLAQFRHPPSYRVLRCSMGCRRGRQRAFSHFQQACFLITRSYVTAYSDNRPVTSACTRINPPHRLAQFKMQYATVSMDSLLNPKT